MGEANAWQPRTIIDLGAGVKAVPESVIALEGQTVINITSFAYVLDTGALLVFKNGHHQRSGIDYGEGTSTSYTFVTPLTVGDVITSIGYTGIVGNVDVRDTDIFIPNHTALAAYIGTETTVYVKGKVLEGDGGEGWYQLYTGSPLGFYIEDGLNVVRPDSNPNGTTAWMRVARYDIGLYRRNWNMQQDIDYTLPSSHSFYGLLKITDTNASLSAGRSIIVDTKTRLFIAINDAEFPLTFKTALGSGIAVAAKGSELLYSDGTNILSILPAELASLTGSLIPDRSLAIGDGTKFIVQSGDSALLSLGAEVIGYSKSSLTYTLDTDQVAELGQIVLSTSISSGVFASIGPSGSGADVILSALNIIPTDAKWVDVSLTLDHTRTLSDSASIGIRYRNEGGAGSGIAVASHSYMPAPGTNRVSDTGRVRRLNLGPNNIFEVSWFIAGTGLALSTTASLYVIGFGR